MEVFAEVVCFVQWNSDTSRIFIIYLDSSWVEILCDKKVLLNLRGKFYLTAVRLVMLYGTECLAVKNQHED